MGTEASLGAILLVFLYVAAGERVMLVPAGACPITGIAVSGWSLRHRSGKLWRRATETRSKGPEFDFESSLCGMLGEISGAALVLCNNLRNLLGTGQASSFEDVFGS